ncbi:helix-turn-helix domain-containing protein [Staphylococcus chromogenes]|nr:helix-turn-helix domain-containing protein [Staphylococcus chromogenes]
MAVIEIRGGVHNHYTPIPNELIRNPDVSHKAVRVYAFLRSHADGWKLNVRALATQLHASTTTVNKAIQELEDLGYVVREWELDDSGFRKGIKYLIFDAPQQYALDALGVLESDTRVSLFMVNQNHGVPETNTHKEEQFLKKNNLKEEQSPSTDVEGPTAPGFDDWYQAYPRHVGKKAAEKAWAKAIKEIDPTTLLERTRAFAAHCKTQRTETRFIPHPATWLNRGGWDDDLGGEQRAPANSFLARVRGVS